MMMLFVSNGDFLVEAVFDSQSLQTRICYIAMLSQIIQFEISNHQTLMLFFVSLLCYTQTTQSWLLKEGMSSVPHTIHSGEEHLQVMQTT